jgi:hypothetical protein
MDTERVSAALKWIQRGFSVFPLRPKTKSEYTNKDDAKGKIWYRPGGTRHDATTDGAIIDGWWRQTPLANIGVIVPEGFVVVDVDVRNDGLKSIVNFVWPDTYSELTASGGHHLIYSMPMRNDLSSFTVAPGIEILTAGTVFMAAPSSTDVGVYKVASDKGIAPCPEWLLDVMRMRTASARPVQPTAQIGNITSYGRAVLEREGQRIERLSEGERAAMLNTIVYHIARLIPSGALTKEAIVAEVERATASWPHQSKVINITNRAIQAGRLKPR